MRKGFVFFFFFFFFGSFAKAPRNQQAIRNVDGELEQHAVNVPA